MAKFVCRTCLLLALLSGVAVTLSAQPPEKPTFEVASIRPGNPGTPSAQRVSEGRVEFVNTPLRTLLLLAYRIQPFQLSAPEWVNNNLRFEIQANIPAGVNRENVPEMLQALLAERFGLVISMETRAVDGYELVVGKDGVTMRQAEPIDELTRVFGGDAASAATDRITETLDGPIRTMMIPLGARTVTSRSLYSTWTTERGTFEVDATRMSMNELAEILSYNVDRPVVDKTALSGVYQFRTELDANASAIRSLMSRGITKTVHDTPINQPTGISTVRAVEGLGLRLQEAQVPMLFVVVEKMSRTPTDN